MMRWLKDKKRERRSNSTSEAVAGEDDYGFGRDKSKSPSTRRLLPPTPATPEEKSPHIYEEIPDLSNAPSTDIDQLLSGGKGKKHKSVHLVPATGSATAETAAINSDLLQSDSDSHTVIPTSGQQPSRNRGGTPEVHCDVIVKDTHCEILLSRKPKVSTIRPEFSSNFTTNKKNLLKTNLGVSCLDYYPSSCQRTTGHLTSSIVSSYTDPQLSSVSSALRSFGNSLENHRIDHSEENNSTHDGVITYSTSTNVIPRSIKATASLVSSRGGINNSDDGSAAKYATIKDNEFESDSQGGSVAYATIQQQEIPVEGSDGHVAYGCLQEGVVTQGVGPGNAKISNSHSKALTGEFITNGGTKAKTGVILSTLSPSNSTNCIYSLVTFPQNSNLYNTIGDVGSDATGNDLTAITSEQTERNGVLYSSINDTSVQHNCAVRRHNMDSSSALETVHASRRLDKQKATDNKPRTNHDTHLYGQGPISRDLCNDVRDFGYTYRSRLHQASHVPLINEVPRSTEIPGRDLSRVGFEFCSCSEDHSLSCTCHGGKQTPNDELSSCASVVNEGVNSCNSCGRLIRRITYSESYSDETYEHVYASRLLIRTGRRFSSPDLTSEVNYSEFPDLRNSRNPDFYAISRDDSWTYTLNSDVVPPSYDAVTDTRTLQATKCFHTSEKCLNNEQTFHDNTMETQTRDRYGISYYCEISNYERSNVPVVEVDPKKDSPVDKLRSDSPLSNCMDRLSTTGSDDVKAKTIGPSNVPGTHNLEFNVSDPKRNCSEQRKKSKFNNSSTTTTKNNTFGGLLFKLSRSKTAKPVTSEQSEVQINATLGLREPLEENQKQDKDLEEIPAKNTKKLSKFFQRLSSKDVQQLASDATSQQTANGHASVNVTPETIHCLGKTSFNNDLRSSTSDTVFVPSNRTKYDQSKSANGGAHNQLDRVLNVRSVTVAKGEKKDEMQFHESVSSQRDSDLVSSLIPSDSRLSSDCVCTQPEIDCTKSVADVTKSKTTFKTDSGDTCYEYDISTSSEGEQVGFDCFLSSVKTSLNLDQEAMQISQTKVKKRLCKQCKTGGVTTSTAGQGEGTLSCSHLEAKFGDLQAMLADLVVDQRAAILDCLSELTSFGGTPGRKGGCCGTCEFDELRPKSLAAMESLLSNLRVTSPGGQNLSCDSDEGTMADNSCESADEGCERDEGGKSNTATVRIDNVITLKSRDEPKGKDSLNGLKLKKKDRKERKSTVQYESSCPEELNSISIDILAMAIRAGKCLPTDLNSAHFVPYQKVHPLQGICEPAVLDTQNGNSACQSNSLTMPRSLPEQPNQVSLWTETQDINLSQENVRNRDIGKTKSKSDRDKVLQDIYAPLPSKAMSLLTSRHLDYSAGQPCTCREGQRVSLATINADLTDKAEAPPSEHIKMFNCANSGPAGLTGSESREKKGVTSVHSRLLRHSKSDGGQPSRSKAQADNISWKSRPETGDLRPEKNTQSHNGLGLSCQNGAGLEHVSSPRTKRGHCALVASRGGPVSGVGNTETVVIEGVELGESSLHEKDAGCRPLLHHTNKRKIGARVSLDNGGPPSMQTGNKGRQETHDWLGEVSRRSSKHRLGTLAFDLLPESPVDGDTPEQGQSMKILPPRRSGVIDKMAKLFENTESHSLRLNKGEQTKSVKFARNQKADPSSADSWATGKNASLISNSSQPGFEHIPAKKFPHASESSSFSKPMGRQNRLRSKSREKCDMVQNDSVSVTPLVPGLNLDSYKGHKQCQRVVGSTKPVVENMTSGNKDRTGHGKPVKAKTTTVAVTSFESRRSKSPTLSNTSSSSASSKEKNDNYKLKSVAKKSYRRKRNKHRPERSKSCHGKEERTYYYFSSDFSDIDTQEVENRTTHQASVATNKKLPVLHKKRSSSASCALRKRAENTAPISNTTPKLRAKYQEPPKMEKEMGSEGQFSSETRNNKGAREAGVAAHPSPESHRARQLKTDVYKQKEGDNKLLSDLIIRNYDMQVYGHV